MYNMARVIAGPLGAYIGAPISNGIAVCATLALIIWKAKADIKQAKQEAKKKKDPAFFRQQMNEITSNFCIQLQKLKFETKIEKKNNKFDVMFLGVTSAGKSSLINNLFGTKLKIGLGITTNQTNLAYENEKIRIWDAVGQNSDFQYFDIDALAVLHSMDIIFILYRNTPKTIQFLIKLIANYEKPRYKVYFIRTCCDQWTKDHQKTLDQELTMDYDILKSFKVVEPKILKTSTKKQGFENEEVKKIIYS